jgi:glycosyltransferase involved in cell wall biosynthesis
MEHAAVLSRMSVPAASFCTVVTLHTLESAYLPLVFTDASLLSEIKGVLKQMHNDSTFTFPSQGCAADFDEYLGASCRRSQVVPNPLNLAHINLRAMNEVPSEFELWCAGRKVISCVARLDPPKDQKTLIRALKRLSARVPQAAVVCIGSGVLEKELKSYAQELGVANKVLFVGYQANPMPFVKAARVSVLSSEFEAFGLVVVEAMAVGTPVIATDCPWGPGEIIGANNDYGILVPVGDEAAMAEALERILNDDDLYAHYSNVGLQRAQNYSYSVLRQAWSVVLDPDLALD